MKFTKISHDNKFISYIYADSSKEAHNKELRIHNLNHRTLDWRIKEFNCFFSARKSIKHGLWRKSRRLLNNSYEVFNENYLRKFSADGYGWKFRKYNGTLAID